MESWDCLNWPIGGDNFMDEIGELDLSMQSKLLRVLESKRLCVWAEQRLRK